MHVQLFEKLLMNRASCFSVACTVPDCVTCFIEVYDDQIDATTIYLDVTCQECSFGHFDTLRTIAYGKTIGIDRFVVFNEFNTILVD